MRLVSILGLWCAALHAGTTSPIADLRPATAASCLSLTLDTGWRLDDFGWTIAGDLSGQHPNVLSELKWQRLDIIPVGLDLDWSPWPSWHLSLNGAYGWIVSGRNRDSDYIYNNRAGEYSRSTADTHGSTVDAGAVIGRDFKMMDDKVTLTPQIGYVFHQQRLNDRNGFQVLDKWANDDGPFAGLDSVYRARWSGGTAGLESRLELAEKWRMMLGARFELLDYSATADWNLRPDFKGFHHNANGTGWALHAGCEHDLDNSWTVGLDVTYGSRKTGHGVDDTLLTNDVHDRTHLNEVQWTSVAVQFYATHRF